MVWQLTDSRNDTDGTDELPVLTQEAILEFEAENQSFLSGPAADPLEASVEPLRELLVQTERRWSSLESTLADQNQAISELLRRLTSSLKDKPTTHSLDETLQPELPTADSSPDPNFKPASKGVQSPGTNDWSSDQNLLERIASLETYIAGRADWWEEMNTDLESKARRIAELEIELAQRVAREQQLEDRLLEEGDRSNKLREKLRRVNRRFQESELISAHHDLDATRELVGRALEGPHVTFHRNSDGMDQDLTAAPRLLCLSTKISEPFVMLKDAITIGRDPDCDIEIATDIVSRHHAMIYRKGSDTVIEDKSSTNGLFVNAQRVERMTLDDGDEITIGETRFRFLRDQPFD